MSIVSTQTQPSKAFHGSWADVRILPICLPASSQDLFVRTSWKQHDNWISGGPHLECGIPYANIIWNSLGLRHNRKRPKNGWLREVKSFEQLSQKIGILFITENFQDAARYGTVFEIDLTSPRILETIEDPHVKTHRGWILLIEAGKPISEFSTPLERKS